jgi:hypothetical protein
MYVTREWVRSRLDVPLVRSVVRGSLAAGCAAQRCSRCCCSATAWSGKTSFVNTTLELQAVLRDSQACDTFPSELTRQSAYYKNGPH